MECETIEERCSRLEKENTNLRQEIQKLRKQIGEKQTSAEIKLLQLKLQEMTRLLQQHNIQAPEDASLKLERDFKDGYSLIE